MIVHGKLHTIAGSKYETMHPFCHFAFSRSCVYIVARCNYKIRNQVLHYGRSSFLTLQETNNSKSLIPREGSHSYLSLPILQTNAPLFSEMLNTTTIAVQAGILSRQSISNNTELIMH